MARDRLLRYMTADEYQHTTMSERASMRVLFRSADRLTSRIAQMTIERKDITEECSALLDTIRSRMPQAASEDKVAGDEAE